MADDLIGAPSAKAQLVITLLDNGTVNVHSNADEIHARFLLSKAAAIMEDTWRMQNAQAMAKNAPRIVPANGGLPRRLHG